ncbi:hypothetical protein EMCRGX_G005401 [Ephydatia muelleri]
MQENRPVAYASRALTCAETRYAQIEKELLAVVFALEKFHQYIYGTNVEIESDQKPLEIITRKQLCQAPPRLQRLLLRLQRYNFTLKYRPGKDMVIADTLSRAYISDTSTDRMDNELMSAVHMVLENAPATDKRIQEIKELTQSDTTLQRLKSVIRSSGSSVASNKTLSPTTTTEIDSSDCERFVESLTQHYAQPGAQSTLLNKADKLVAMLRAPLPLHLSPSLEPVHQPTKEDERIENTSSQHTPLIPLALESQPVPPVSKESISFERLRLDFTDRDFANNMEDTVTTPLTLWTSILQYG